jgi:hypothetical protein
MTREDQGHFRNKRRSEAVPPPELLEAVRKSARENRVSCAGAFRIAKRTGFPPDRVGAALDHEEISLGRCQLGLFGYGRENKILVASEAIDPKLKGMIGEALVDGRLPCAAAWEIARRCRVSRMAVSGACEAMKIKISRCQLGAF